MYFKPVSMVDIINKISDVINFSIKNAKCFKYVVIPKIFIYLQNQHFSMCSLLHKLCTFLALIELPTLIIIMKMHSNPEPSYYFLFILLPV